jgi:cell pole-organizing protein PopZ
LYWEEVSDLAEEQEVERLFGLGPESFVAARTEAARRLKREGDAGAAARVTALRRPPLSAWAVNQLARTRGPELAGLLEVGARLRAAHRDAVSGGGAAALRAAARAEREAVAGLVAAAVQVLESTGHAATEATRDRIAATLHAAAADPAAAEEVRRGRLTHDLDPTGFGTPDALGGVVAAPEAERAAANAAGGGAGHAAGGRRAGRAAGKGRAAGARAGNGQGRTAASSPADG